jgi:hypothetical protein
MALRTFSDAAGTEWRVWDVHAKAGDRRSGQDRRGEPAPDPVIERRRLPDRRVDSLRRPAGTLSGLPGGWLCFEAGPADAAQRRRLVPIPPAWETCSDTELRAYLAQAVPARRSARSPEAGGPSVRPG